MNKLLISVWLFSITTSFGQNLYSNWSHYNSITLNTTADGANIATLQTNFPVLIRLTSAEAEIFNGSQLNGEDIRFTKSSNGQRLPHQIETWDKKNRTAAIWVLVDSISGMKSSPYLKMYWGNSASTDSSQPTVVFDTTNGFQALWHLQEKEGELAHDATLNGFNATPFGTVKPVDTIGVCGNAKVFDGTSSHYRVLGTAKSKLSFPDKSQFTLSAWVYLKRVTGKDQIIVSKGPIQWRLKSITGWRAFDYIDKGGWDGIESNPAQLFEWKHIAFVRNGTAKNLYVNGIPDEVPYFTPATGNRIDSFDVELGRENGFNSGFLMGRLDEVRLENRARSQDWIKLGFANQRLSGQSLVFLGPSMVNSTQINAGHHFKKSGTASFKPSLVYSGAKMHQIGVRSLDAKGDETLYRMNGKNLD